MQASAIWKYFSSNRILQLGLGFWLTVLVWDAPLLVPAYAEKEESRFCQGFLYCEETKGDTTSTQAFFYLYSTEERGAYSRLTVIPFYSREMNPETHYLRRSVLWPLGISEVKGDASYLQILPFYWHAEDPTRQYTVLAPLYFNYESGDRSYTHLIPLYGHHQHGNYYHRYFVLGPLAMATYNTNTSFKEWDVLFPLIHYETGLRGSATRLFPIYFSGDNRQDGSWYRHILPLYGRSVSPEIDLGYLFPFYGSFTNTAGQETRTSAIGLPPIPRLSLPALALYEHASTPTSVSDRLFPLYSYEEDQARSHTGWSFLGYNEFTLTGYGRDSNHTWHQFIPLYRTSEDLATQTQDTTVLGIGPLSLFRAWTSPEGSGHRFFPLYLYDHPGPQEWHWSALFPGPLSLYRHDRTGNAIQDRFTPLYDWRRDGEKQALSVLGASTFSMFYQERSGAEFSQRLFPLYGYRSSDQGMSQLSFMGFPPQEQSFAWSLYEQARSPTYFLTRFFPLYRFERNDETKEVNWSAILLYQHTETESYLRDEFLPLHEYERDARTDTTELNLIGLKPITFFKQSAGPDVRRSYLFPLYDYDRKGAASRLALIGWPHMGTLPTLSLFEREETDSLDAHRFFPLYRYRRDNATDARDWDALFLWWHRQTKTHLRDTFIPLTDIEQEGETGGSRVSLIGLPRIGDLPALTLFNWEQTPSLNTHRFFPLYHYSYDQPQDATTWNALWLYWHYSDPAETHNTFFPLGSLRQNADGQAWDFSALGVEPLSLVQVSGGPASVRNRFSPLWDYHEEGGDWGLSFVGIRELSLFSHEETAGSTTDHFFPVWFRTESEAESRNLIFPLWSTAENRRSRERSTGLLGVGPVSLYYREQSPAGITTRLFPVWSDHYEEATQESRTGVLGVAPFSLYYGRTNPTAHENRLFPFFRYTNDRIKDESEFWFLWPLFDRKTAQGRTTETSCLWWLFEYRSPKEDEWEYWILGHPPIAMYMRTVTPARTLVEVNPIIPGWRREYVEGVGTSWALFGGLIGMDAMPDGTHKLRLFWRDP
ncbi:hypothetical protein ACO9S2_14325 [Nitrospira sp. NS4]|uniref:hypothetical protein n=1 Tax=Nitrospira sp. NS4 TaxID=3414498 RepID=UPI003C2B69E8